MRPAPFLSSLACSLLIASPVAFAQTSLESGFQTPPPTAKPHTWWHWINGNISKEGITADLEAMKAVGIGGAQIFNVDVGIPAGQTPFMSAQWREAMSHALREAKRLGIEICLHNCAGWSSSGGPWITPENAMQALTWSETPVTGPLRFDGVLPEPGKNRDYYRDIAVYAVRKPEKETDTARLRIENIRAKAAFERGDNLTPNLQPTPPGMATPADAVRVLTGQIGPDGRLSWDVPAGQWVLIRMGYTPTGAQNAPAPDAGRGLEVDKLSRKALDTHWAGMMATILRDLGPDAPAALNNALIDSYEVGSQNWTPEFRAEFQKRRGYDCLPFLPVVTGRVIGDRATSERFLWDFRRTVCDLFADNYFGYFGELCHKNGLKFSVEGYGNAAFDNLQVGGLADIPMGEFWVGGAALESTKLASSAGHTNGHSVIGAESFTADESRARWLVDPYSIKALGDRIFSLGVNRYIFHRYTHQPWSGKPADHLLPGMTMGPWGMNFERTITWWNQSPAWLSYIARCQYLLQSGRFAADVVYFTGDDGPNDLPFLKNRLVPEGYDYDGCDTTVLQKMTIDKGEIVLPSGMRYRVLLLPNTPTITARTLRKIASLVRAGATVIGKPFQTTPSLAEGSDGDTEVKRLSQELWGATPGKPGEIRRVGKGIVQMPMPETKALLGKHIGPDCAAASGTLSRLVWIHRKTTDADYYFVGNQRNQPIRQSISFRIHGRSPELWNPETGQIAPPPLWQEKDKRTTVTLSLGPAESVFVVFRKSAEKAAHLASFTPPDSATPAAAPPITIEQAFYEAVDGAGRSDVTATVRERVAAGDSVITANNDTFGDPTVNHVKRLRVVYTQAGKRQEKSVGENEELDLLSTGSMPPPDYQLFVRGKETVLRSWTPGKYRYTHAGNSNKAESVFDTPGARSVALTAPWTVTFPPDLGAPPSVQLDSLVPLSQHSDPGVRYFSGTATYTTTITLPADLFTVGNALLLDLGEVKNIAEVTVNGKRLPTLWKPPFRLEANGVLRPGRNTLTIEVTDLWSNRLIGDEQEPAEVIWNGNAIAAWPDWLTQGKPRPASSRITFTTWRVYSKDSPLPPSGLIGPVTVQVVPEVLLPH